VKFDIMSFDCAFDIFRQNLAGEGNCSLGTIAVESGNFALLNTDHLTELLVCCAFLCVECDAENSGS